MTSLTPPSEIDRADSREDIAHLRKVIAEHIVWNHALNAGQNGVDLPFDPIIMDNSDPERNLALVAIAMTTCDDPSYLGLVSAGLLEDVFFMENFVTDELLDRIAAEAERNLRFRWMLSGMYTSTFRPECRNLVERLTQGVSLDDPLPPMENK